MLSPRLNVIKSLISKEYDHIWDCCCDHGKLGLSVLESLTSATVHFVDVVPELIQSIEERLSKNSMSKGQGQTHCLDAAKLPLGDYEGRHLVIIAGVGGDLVKQILLSLHQAFPKLSIDYLLCPIRQIYTLRSELNERSFVVKVEKLVKDKDRYYEIMLVSENKNGSAKYSRISRVGDGIWKATTAAEKTLATTYLQQLTTHYTRMQNAGDPKVDEILHSYQRISI